MKIIHLALAASFLAAPLAILAQQPGYPAPAQGIQNQQYREQQRINQGVRSGELNQGEANNLEQHQRGISRQEARMRARHGGRLTRRDRRKLRRREHRQSRRIRADKHNGYVQ